MTLEQDRERGFQAELLIESQIYKDAIEGVRDGIIAAWSMCPVRDLEGQHELKLMLKLLGDLTNNIKMIAENGKLAKIEIERQKSIKDRIKEFI